MRTRFDLKKKKKKKNPRKALNRTRGVDYVNVMCEVGWMCVCFVMMHYSFSSGTHGKVFTKPSAKIASLNWADVQLLRKWMLFKGGQPVSHTCQCKRTLSLSLSASFFISLCLCVWSSSVTYYGHMWWVFLPQIKSLLFSFLWFGAPVCMFSCVLYFRCKPVVSVDFMDFMSLNSSSNYNKTVIIKAARWVSGYISALWEAWQILAQK